MCMCMCIFPSLPAQRKLFRKIKEGRYSFEEDYWGDVSTEARDLIRHLLILDAKRRLTVDGALGHAWVRKATSDLEVRKLQKQLQTFKAFNGRRKLKGAAQAVIAINRVKRFSASFIAKTDDGLHDARDEDEISGHSSSSVNPVAAAPAESK